MFGKLWLVLLLLAMTGGAALARIGRGIHSRAGGSAGSRNSYIAPQSAVYVVDNVKRQIVLCKQRGLRGMHGAHQVAVGARER